MNRSRSTVCFLAVLSTAFGISAQQIPNAPSLPPTPQEEATGVVAGTVVSAKTGEALKSAQVYIVPMGANAGTNSAVPTNVSTDAEGRFEIQQVVRGEYGLQAQKNGYEAAAQPMRITLGTGETRKNLVLKLQPAAVVTGHVFDGYGDPLPGAQVYAITKRRFLGRANWSIERRAETDDLGEYRLHNLPKGKYFIAAKAPGDRIVAGMASVEFAASYYPGSATRENATPIKIAYGADLSGIDFRLEHGSTSLVRGLIVDAATGKPCGDCGVSVEQGDDINLGVQISTTSDGLFMMQGFRPGKCTVRIRIADALYREELQVPQSGKAEAALSVGNTQIVSGEIVLDQPPARVDSAGQTQDPAEQQKDDQQTKAKPPILIRLEPVASGPSSGARGMTPPEGGAFEMQNVVPDEYTILLQGSPGYLKSVLVNGRDANGPIVKVSPDGPLTGLAVHVAPDGATVSGVLKPPRDGGSLLTQTIFAIPAENSDPYATPAQARAEPDGSFRLNSLVPGSYVLYVAPREDLDIEDPELRRVLQPYSKRVTLRKNETAAVELEGVPESVELW